MKVRNIQVGQRVLLLLPTTAGKLFVKCLGLYEVVQKTGDVTYVIRIPGTGHKQYHINLLKEWKERVAAGDDEDDGLAGWELSVDWDEEGRERTMELHKQIEEGIPVSVWQIRQIDQVLSHFPELFADAPFVAKGVVHRIQTDPGVVVRAPSRPVPLSLQQTIEDQVQTMLQLGVIEPSVSPWRSPPVLVPKPDSFVRFCIDFCQINAVSTFDAYPMPQVDTLRSEKPNIFQL